MLWGKFKGEKMINVPAGYLMWLYDKPKLDVSSVIRSHKGKDTEKTHPAASKGRAIFGNDLLAILPL